MDYGQYVELQTKLESYFDSRYRKIDDCQEIVDKEGAKIAEITKEFAKFHEEVRVDIAKTNTRLNILIAILTAISVPILSLCVKMFFG